MRFRFRTPTPSSTRRRTTHELHQSSKNVSSTIVVHRPLKLRSQRLLLLHASCGNRTCARHEPASFVTSTVFVDAEPSLQSPPRSHRRASSTPRLRGHAPTLRCWKWRVVSDALTLVVTSTIIDGVTPSVNGCRGDLLCVSGRSTRPSDDDTSRSLIAHRRCSTRRRWIAVLKRRLGVGNPVQQQLYRATTSDDTRHSSGMAEYATLVPTTCSVGSTGVLSLTVLLSAALLADSAVTNVYTPAPSDNVFVHDKPSASRRTLSPSSSLVSAL